MAFIDKFVSLYHLNNNAQDAIGPNNGTEGFAAYTTDAPIGSHAFAGDAVDKRTNIGSDVSLDITAAISIGGLIKPATTTGYVTKAIVNKLNTYSMWVGFPTANLYGFSVFIGASWKSAVATGVALDTVNSQAVIGTYDGSHVKIFVNKILRGIRTQSGSMLANPSLNTVIHSFGNEAGGFLNAKSDEIFIANDALTDGGVTILGNTATGEVAEVTDLLLAGIPLDGAAFQPSWARNSNQIIGVSQ